MTPALGHWQRDPNIRGSWIHFDADGRARAVVWPFKADSIVYHWALLGEQASTVLEQGCIVAADGDYLFSEIERKLVRAGTCGWPKAA